MVRETYSILLVCWCQTVIGSTELRSEDAFQSAVVPFLKKHCVDCHGDESPEGGVNLVHFSSKAEALKDSKTWLRVWDSIEGGSMPPSTETRPALADAQAVIDWIEQDYLTSLKRDEIQSEQQTLRRLNRVEYNNTIRDLLGVSIDLAKDFPADEISFGYDNIGTALSISPIHVEKYLSAAERALETAINIPEVGDQPPVELIGLTTYPLPADGSVSFEHHLAPGEYFVDFSLVRAGVSETVPSPTMQVSFGSDWRRVDAVRVQDETVVYRFWMRVGENDKSVNVKLAEQQTHKVDSITTNEVNASVSGDQRYGANRGLHVDSMVVRGPVAWDASTFPSSHHKNVFGRPDFGDDSRKAWGHKFLQRFVERAYRRPVQEADTQPAFALFDRAILRGESFERSLQIASALVLVSPKFLFHHSTEKNGTAPSNDSRCSDYVLANRLSYFLWNSMPDDDLLQAAKENRLKQNLEFQLTRMMQDSKSDSFVTGFVGQWLLLRKLSDARPDAELFPSFNEQLRESMRIETESFVSHILRENKSVLELLDTDYTFANETLAKHYGLPFEKQNGLDELQYRRLSIPRDRRGGLLTHGSILTLTSNPNRTSPVKRGQWILEHLLGTPPPPPPPNVPALEESKNADDVVTLREKLEVHRSSPDCAACHNQMDSLGFALENYDAIGRWRERDGANVIDSRGELPGGRTFANANDLRHLMATTETKRFTRCLIENLLTYALGRGLEPTDYGAVESIRREIEKHEFRSHALLIAIISSQPFQSH